MSDFTAGPDDASRWPRPPLRLTHLLYGTAMLGATLATFGPAGIPLGIVLILFWAWIFLQRNRPGRFAEALVALFIVCGLCCMMLPAVRTAREAARRSSCAGHMKQIVLALHNYHDHYKSFPPAYLTDADGKPMHSWRVLILPFMEHQSLYNKYRFDEPWDGPNNRLLATKMPHGYDCSSDPRNTGNERTTTSYVAVVGPDAAWPLDQSRSLSEFVDGTSDTLLVMESHGKPIHWMEPRDLTVEEAIAAFTSPEPTDYGHMNEDFFYNRSYGRNIGITDGSVRFLGNLTRDKAERLIVVDDGTIDFDSAAHEEFPYQRPNYGNWFRLAVFLVLLFLPLPWVWVHPYRSPSPPAGESVDVA